MDENMWDSVKGIRQWLDDEHRLNNEGAELTGPELQMRHVRRVAEEYKQVAEALEGAVGADPKKGKTHTWLDVGTELCHVAVAALVALTAITPDAELLFDIRLQDLANRVTPPDDSSGEPSAVESDA